MDKMISFVVSALIIVSNWVVYRKMGRQGWESIIPFYNSYVMFEVLYGNGWKFLTLLIPIYNIYVFFKLYIDLAHGFSKSTGFGVGLALLSPIFLCILAFTDDAQFFGGETVKFTEEVNTTINNVTESKNADQLQKYKDLLDSGAISQEEYEAKKNELLHK